MGFDLEAMTHCSCLPSGFKSKVMWEKVCPKNMNKNSGQNESCQELENSARKGFPSHFLSSVNGRLHCTE